MNTIKRVVLAIIMCLPYTLFAGKLQFKEVITKFNDHVKDGKAVEKLEIKVESNLNLHVTLEGNEKDTFCLSDIVYPNLDKKAISSSDKMGLTKNQNIQKLLDEEILIIGKYDGSIVVCKKNKQNQYKIISENNSNEKDYVHKTRITALASFKDEHGRYNVISGDSLGQVNWWQIVD